MPSLIIASLVQGWRIWQLVVLALLFVGGCGMFTAAGLLFATGFRGPSSKKHGPQAFIFESAEAHFHFTCKLADWRQVPNDTQEKLKPLLVLHRQEPNSTMAICVQDLHGQNPNDDQLRELTLTKLQSGFQGLKYLDWRKSDLANQEARRLTIQADSDALGYFVVGECDCLFHDGRVYYFIVWRPSERSVSLAEEWKELRSGFASDD